MQLKDHISLSKKHQKTFQVFPVFFTVSLNEFYFLKDDFGFRKPELSTWRNEATLKFKSDLFDISIQYEAPNWVEISFRKPDISGYLYLERLLEKLNIPFREDLLRIQKDKDIDEIQHQMTLCFQEASTLIKTNWKSIKEYMNDVESFMN